MIDKAGTYMGRVRDLTKRLLRNAVAGTILTLAFSACAHRSAEADINPNIGFEYQQSDRYSLSYSIAREAMKEVYAPAIANGAPDGNPLIGIGEVNLNKDSYPEIIAFPTEEEEEVGLYCKKDVCPHYVLEVRDKKVRTLAVIFADSIALGDHIADGYWELLAYKGGNTDPKKAEVYQYNKNKDEYLPKPQTSAKP